MTNHENFPWWRLRNHIIIVFKYGRGFSSCPNTYANRKYLIESDYLRNAQAIIYPDKIQVYYPEDFKDVAMMENQEENVK